MPKTLRGSFEQALRPLPCVVKGVQACRLPGLKCLKRCAAASSRHSGHCPLLLSAFKPATWLNARLWPQILRSFVLHDSIDWFRCENLSRKPYKHIITSYVCVYIYVYPHPWKGVGGTRALAHSIIWKSMGRIIPYIMENKSHVPNHQPAKWWSSYPSFATLIQRARATWRNSFDMRCVNIRCRPATSMVFPGWRGQKGWFQSEYAATMDRTW